MNAVKNLITHFCLFVLVIFVSTANAFQLNDNQEVVIEVLELNAGECEDQAICWGGDADFIVLAGVGTSMRMAKGLPSRTLGVDESVQNIGKLTYNRQELIAGGYRDIFDELRVELYEDSLVDTYLAGQDIDLEKVGRGPQIITLEQIHHLRSGLSRRASVKIQVSLRQIEVEER